MKTPPLSGIDLFAMENAALDFGTAGGLLLQMVVGLGLVVLLIYLLAFFIKRLPGAVQQHKGRMSIVGGLSLGPRERVVLLELDGERVLVGIVPGSIAPLCVLPAAERVEHSAATGLHAGLSK